MNKIKLFRVQQPFPLECFKKEKRKVTKSLYAIVFSKKSCCFERERFSFFWFDEREFFKLQWGLRIRMKYSLKYLEATALFEFNEIQSLVKKTFCFPYRKRLDFERTSQWDLKLRWKTKIRMKKFLKDLEALIYLIVCLVYKHKS